MTDADVSHDWQLATYPRPLPLVRALLGAPSPLVMVDLMSFRERATGTFEGRSGREAYDEYIRSAQLASGPMGSKLLWSGSVEPVADGRPPFEVAALLQYASPRAFLRAALRGRAEGAARTASIAGQWLIAAQTLDSAPWDATDHCALLELVGVGDDGADWLKARRAACTGLDGELVWRGRVVAHVIGDGPRIDEVLVTGFPHAEARRAALEALTGIADDIGVEVWWTYHGKRIESSSEPRE